MKTSSARRATKSVVPSGDDASLRETKSRLSGSLRILTGNGDLEFDVGRCQITSSCCGYCKQSMGKRGVRLCFSLMLGWVGECECGEAHDDNVQK